MLRVLGERSRAELEAGLWDDWQRRSVLEVTSESSDPLKDGQAVAPIRAQTFALQGLANRLIRGLVRTPGLPPHAALMV